MKNIMKKGLVASALLAAISGSAFAASTSATFEASATISAACVVSATNVAFGTVTPAATGNAAATGTITSTCSNLTAYTLSVDKGTGTSIAARNMSGATGNTDKLNYNLFTDAGHQSIFGDGVTGVTVPAVGNGAAQTTTVYGQLPLNQYLKADAYTDTLTVTLAY